MEEANAYKMLTANKLKLIAAFFMFFDHFASVFFPHNAFISLVLRMVGRTAAPVFCFSIAMGYHYTSNLRNYILRLLLLALISHIPYNLAFAYSLSVLRATSVVWPLALGLIALAVFKNEKINIFLKLALSGAACILSYTANWNFFAVLWILAFGLFHGNFKRQIAGFTLIGAAYILWQLRRYGLFHEFYPQWFQFGIFLSIPLLAMYNGRGGKKSLFSTWFFYVFYPLHLIILYLLKSFTPLAGVLGSLF